MGIFGKLKESLAKVGGGMLAGVFAGPERIDEDFYEELEEALIVADVGMETTEILLARLRQAVKEQELHTRSEARQAMALFGSSSPSYLILQSLDACNRSLAGDYRERLTEAVRRLEQLKARLMDRGVPVRPGEPMKLVVDGWAAGCSGYELADLLRQNGVEPEYADPDEVVLMYSADVEGSDFQRVETAFSQFRPGNRRTPAALPASGARVLSPREAMLSPWEEIPVREAAGRICAGAAVSCPPAIPIAVSGERITAEAAAFMAGLGFETVSVVRKNMNAN